jgi:hypothetical protein
MDLLINEVGSPQMKAAFEVEYCINAFRAAAGVPRRLVGQTMPLDRPGAFGMSVREPVGVIGCITPFNVPLLKNVKQIAMVIATWQHSGSDAFRIRHTGYRPVRKNPSRGRPARGRLQLRHGRSLRR